MNKSAWIILLLCFVNATKAKSHSSMSKDSLAVQHELKNKLGIELLGNPLMLYYERQVYSHNKYSLHVTAGLNVATLSMFGAPGLSLGTTHHFKLKKSFYFFVIHRFEFLTFSFPNYAFTSEKISQGLSFNLVGTNLGTGILIKKKHWEFAPLYPSLIGSLSAYHDGEDEQWILYPSLALNTRIAFRF